MFEGAVHVRRNRVPPAQVGDVHRASKRRPVGRLPNRDSIMEKLVVRLAKDYLPGRNVDFLLHLATFRDKVMDFSRVSPKQLRQAADLQERIQALQGELQQLMGGEVLTPAQSLAPEDPKRRKMSDAGRARIAAGARARWAKIRASKTPSPPPQEPKRRMSAAAKARLSRIAKARWKTAKAQGKAKL